MLQLLKHYCSVFEGIILFSDVYVPQYQVAIEQVPEKVGISYFRKAVLEHTLFHRLDLGMFISELQPKA